MSILAGRFGLLRKRTGYITFQKYGVTKQRRIRGRGMKRGKRKRFY